jgi:hypothetical protein
MLVHGIVLPAYVPEVLAVYEGCLLKKADNMAF